jgi:Undecaprenyl-phosphate glucose phosphotransferase
MLKRNQRGLGQLFLIVDALIVVMAWLGAYWARFFVGPLPATRGLPAFHTYAALAPLVALLWMAVLALSRVHETGRRLGRAYEIGRVLRAHGIALLLFIALTYLFEHYKYSRLVMIYFAALGAVGLGLFHFTLKSVLGRVRSWGLNLRRVLVAGEGPGLEALIARIDAYPELGLSIVGVVTPDDVSATSAGGKPVIGRCADVCEIVQAERVHEVLIALPHARSQEIDALLGQLKDETVDVRLVLDVHRHVTLNCEIEEFDGLPIVGINDSPLIGAGAFAKRVTDVMLSALALVVLSPLLFLIAALVKLTSPGPVLYSQERMGLDGRSFRMWKFRSMRVDAEARTGAVWAQASDGRRTAFGTFLRKTSLDELPQLWNVLRGDMSLVGPRPERPVFVQRFRKEIPHYMLRHKVQAGITGWAQVNGWRGNTSLDRRIECDLFYIRNWSYALDLKILTLTLWKGFIHKNAY